MKRIIYTLACLFALLLAPLAQAESIYWSGLTWDIRSDNGGPYGPGPNYFQGKGVSVDKSSRLHLLLSQDAQGRWQCPEIVSRNSLGFGEYAAVIDQVLVNGQRVPITSLDQNAVFGFFGYPTSAQGPDGTNEFDIELSYWGGDPASTQNFIQLSNWASTLTPGKSSQMWRGKDFNSNFDLAAMNPLGISIIRTRDAMEWRLWDGFSGAYMNHREEGLSTQQVSQISMPFHFNVWLKDSKPPIGPVEVIISKFSFSPLK